MATSFVVARATAPMADASAVMATIGRALGLAGIDAPGAFDLVAAHLQESRCCSCSTTSSTFSAPQPRPAHDAYDEAVAAGRSLDPSAVPEVA